MMKSAVLAFVALAVSGYTEAIHYSRVANLHGQSFLDAFWWETQSDPTHGRVQYVDLNTAYADGLVSVSDNSVTLRADHTTWLSSSDPGRKSFRLHSYNKYERHVSIFNIGHMPVGCGTWPALVGDNWPWQGEIDIIEGTNDEIPNQSTLHSSPNCVMPEYRWMTGTNLGGNCDVYETGNVGCPVHLADSNSYGHNFNNIGGGWYALERSSTEIKIWFWPRYSSSVPSEVSSPGDSVNTDTWGEPSAWWGDQYCKFATHFGAMSIIINLTFCGDWAGALFNSAGCPGTCNDYVDNNPEAFHRAFFEIGSLNIYQ